MWRSIAEAGDDGRQYGEDSEQICYRNAAAHELWIGRMYHVQHNTWQRHLASYHIAEATLTRCDRQYTWYIPVIYTCSVKRAIGDVGLVVRARPHLPHAPAWSTGSPAG
jgi:hypothetical protein